MVLRLIFFKKICATGADGFVHFVIVSPRRIFALVYVLIFFAVSTVFGVSLWQARAEYQLLLKQEATSRQRLGQAQQRLREQEKVLQRLRTDPTYVERVIRQRLGYAKPDETIFRFEP